jgi:hypothetical protein
VSSLGAFLLAVVAGIGIFTYRNVEKWTPLQQWYWVEYLSTKSFPSARGDYRMLAKVDGHGKQRMAVDADVVPGPQQGWPPLISISCEIWFGTRRSESNFSHIQFEKSH